MKTKVNVLVNDIKDITEFSRLLSQFSGEAHLIKGKYECDAKSLMGLLAIDTSEPTILEFDINDREEMLKLVNKFIVK